MIKLTNLKNELLLYRNLRKEYEIAEDIALLHYPNSKLAKKSQKGYDLITEDKEKIQVKFRNITKQDRIGIDGIKSNDFDKLFIVVAENYNVIGCSEIPHNEFFSECSFNKKKNMWMKSYHKDDLKYV